VVHATTTTTTIEEVWPDGWSALHRPEVLEAGLLLAEVGEQLGWARASPTSISADGEVEVNPFQTISRRFPL